MFDKQNISIYFLLCFETQSYAEKHFQNSKFCSCVNKVKLFFFSLLVEWGDEKLTFFSPTM